MKPLASPVLFFLSLLATAAMGAELTLNMGDIQIEDGDTLSVPMNGEAKRVQIAGIDAPEDTDNPKMQRDLIRTGMEPDRLLKLGVMSTEYLRRLVRLGAPFTLKYQPGKVDRYGRIGAGLWDSADRSVAESMVKGGYAVALPGDSEQAKRLNALQAQAKQTDAGLWGIDPEAARAWAGQ